MPLRYEARHERRGPRRDRHLVESKSVRLPVEDGPALMRFYEEWADTHLTPDDKPMSVNAAMVEALREFRRHHQHELATDDAEAPTVVLSAPSAPEPAEADTQPVTLVQARAIPPEEE
jgi:hypothetical protein